MKKIAVLLMVMMLASCSSSWHLKRAIMKDPAVMVPKEVVIRDTVYTKEVLLRDSFYLKEIDTIVLEKDRYWTKIVRVRDSVYVDGGCLSDTVYIEKRVFVPKVEYVEKDNPSIWWLIFVLIILSIVGWEFLKGRRL